MRLKLWMLALFITVILLASTACNNGGGSSSTSVPVYSQYQLAYRVLQAYPDYFWCDPDYYPIARDEQTPALEQYPVIRDNIAEFEAILEQTGLVNKTDYSDQEKLTIYQEHKKINYAVSLTSSGDIYNFIIRVGKDQGKSIQGTITSSGLIEVFKEESSFNTCPICLTSGTLISTPLGEIKVEQLKTGMLVWTQNESGERVASPILKTSSTRVPASFRAVQVNLADGRMVTASPGHPSADNILLGDYKVGDILDGSKVVSLDNFDYNGGFTYDLLPSEPGGLYWANGILLKSTLY
jgi:hypothetical protein